ncbi:MAG: metalloregulator ArsR/SmtB family transcription factor [Gemmatimonadota bacterium]|nr:metalloregulator ArsR/SmtB family transcription factor [Gemmatimonadota bacterium]
MIPADPVFAALADPTRRAILDLMRGGELPAGEVASRFPVSRPAISRHLRVLRHAGLVHERRSAQLRLYSLDPTALQVVDRWLDQYRVAWATRRQALKRHVEQPDPPRPPRDPKGHRGLIAPGPTNSSPRSPHPEQRSGLPGRKPRK